MTDQEHTYDVEDDVLQFVGAAFQELDGRPVTVEKLVELYKPPTPNNMTTLVANHRKDTGDKSASQTDVKSKLIREVLRHARNRDGGSAFAYDEDEKTWRLIDEFGEAVDIHRVKYGDDLLIRPRALPDLFNPETGLWRNGCREVDPAKLEKLEASMRAHGWVKGLEAIVDENGVRIVGGRQLEVANKLNIEPRVKKMTLGKGEAADAKRAALMGASNSGREDYSPAERRKIAEDLRLQNYSYPKIAELLKVSSTTVWRDLQGFTNVKPDPKRGGRPKGKKGANPKTGSGSGSNGSTPNGSGPQENQGHGGPGTPGTTPHVDINNGSGVPATPKPVPRILGGFDDDEWELPLDKDEMEAMEQAAREAHAALPKPPKPPYTVNRVYDRMTFEADLHVSYMEVLFDTPRFKKTVAELNRDHMVAALNRADTLRGRWQALLDKMDAERVKQMSFDDEWAAGTDTRSA